MKLRVFILDDEIHAPNYRHPLKDALLAAHHEVTCATSCEDAKAKFVGPYDLIFLDHDMNGYFSSIDTPNSGYQFTRWMTEAEDGIETDPLVVCHSHNAEARKAMLLLLKRHGYRVVDTYYGTALINWVKKEFSE